MTPQATIAALFAGTWAAWAGARFVALRVRRRRRKIAQAIAVGKPAIRNEFPRAVRDEILNGPLRGWRRLCRKCWRRRSDVPDHLISSAEGGGNKADNGAPVCTGCNGAKSSRHELWAVLRWVTPWVGWRWPVPTPVMLAVAMVAAVVMIGAV